MHIYICIYLKESTRRKESFIMLYALCTLSALVSWTSRWHSWLVVEPVRGGTLWEVFRSLWVWSWELSSLSLHSLAYDVAILHCHAQSPCCAALPKAWSNETIQSWTGSSKTVWPNKLFFISWFSQIFWYSDGKFTKAYCNIPSIFEFHCLTPKFKWYFFSNFPSTNK
jgi:hypothetical protein